MNPRKTITLCPECGACPEIIIYENEVRIGEEGNSVMLNIDQWNYIVEKILRGEIGKI